MIRYTIFALLLFVAGQAVAWKAPSSLLAALRDIGLLALSVPMAYYLVRLFRWCRGQLLWKVRNRIIVSYVVVGLVPVVLLGLIGWLALAVTFKQLSTLYLASEIQKISEALRETSTRTLLQYHTRRAGSTVTLEDLAGLGRSQLEALPSTWGPASVEVVEPGPEGAPPEWLGHGFQGFVNRPEGLWLVSTEPAEHQTGSAVLVIGIPFGTTLLDDISRRTSIRMRLIQSDSSFAANLARFGQEQNRLAVSGAHLFTPVDWETGAPTAQMAILLSVPISTLVDHFFARGGTLLFLLLLVLALFLLVELGAVVVAARMARSITRSVADIYAGLRRIQEGDFSVRIRSGDRDQLDAMAGSFNRMAASMERLMGEVAAKEWLAREIEIASQVQKQLFPRRLPALPGVQLAATCIPARHVSGDYYDFIQHAGDRLDIIIGDISGKGISAALTMASAQSSIRSQLLGHRLEDPRRLPSTMSIVSRQLYEQSQAQTFSTAVLASLDAGSRDLTYCNAGHNPPLLFSNGRVERLDCGGTVAGLIEVWDYQQGDIRLAPGDVLLLFTDGVTEACDHGGHEFGEDQLVELVRGNTFLTAHDIQELIVGQVFDFCGEQEQADDITVVCLKME